MTDGQLLLMLSESCVYVEVYRENFVRHEFSQKPVEEWFDWLDKNGHPIEGKEPWRESIPPPDLYEFSFEQKKKLDRINRFLQTFKQHL